MMKIESDPNSLVATMPELTLDHASTALVLIDLQRGITAGQTVPHAAADVIARGAAHSSACRPRGVHIVLVRVDPGPNGVLFPRPQADQPRPPMTISPDWVELVPELGREASDVVVTKHQPNAFYATDLEVQLQRRGVRTLILGGIRPTSAWRRRRAQRTSAATSRSSYLTSWLLAKWTCTTIP